MAKKKLKKLLKGLGIGAALLGAGKALMNRNARASTTADAIKAMTSDAAYGKSPYTDAIMRRQALRNQDMNPAMFLTGVGDDPVIPGMQAGAKKGGRIVKTKKGGRAVRKANRSKKK